MPEHPGGADYISDNLGKNINEDFYEAEHTKFARKIFNDLPVRGKMDSSSEQTTKSTESSESISKAGDPVIDRDYVADKNSKMLRTD